MQIATIQVSTQVTDEACKLLQRDRTWLNLHLKGFCSLSSRVHTDNYSDQTAAEQPTKPTNLEFHCLLPYGNKLVCSMLRPEGLQVNRIIKIITFASKLLKYFLERTMAHLPACDSCTTALRTHWQWVR